MHMHNFTDHNTYVLFSAQQLYSISSHSPLHPIEHTPLVYYMQYQRIMRFPLGLTTSQKL